MEGNCPSRETWERVGKSGDETIEGVVADCEKENRLGADPPGCLEDLFHAGRPVPSGYDCWRKSGEAEGGSQGAAETTFPDDDRAGRHGPDCYHLASPACRPGSPVTVRDCVGLAGLTLAHEEGFDGMIGAWSQLDQRSREVLASVVGAYILSAAPVSSRLLTKSGGFSLSSASLRNAMAELEDLGYLTHPHASAGRVPTDLGYRTYVKELMTARPPGLAEKAKIASGLGSETFELERFLHATSRVLSELTGEVAVAAVPDSAHVVLRSVHFTRVAERKVVVVTVSGEGLVGSRLIETREDLSSDALQTASNRLTAEYAGRTLLEIRTRLIAALQEEKVRFDAEIARALELARQAFVDERTGGETLVVEGAGTILEKPEFQNDVESLRRMYRALEEEARLVDLLTDCLASGSQPTVLIGSDSAFTEETQTAVVVTAYRSGDRILGALGIIGPRRMEYPRVVPLVEELGRYVTMRLSEGV
jgi:heat-inducible transcriptional repressor